MFLRKLRMLAEIVGFGAIVFLVANGAIVFVRNSPMATAAGLNSPVAAVPQQSAPQAIANVDAITVQDVPPFIGYSGILKDGEGKPLTGVYSVTFRIYDNVTALPAQAIWTESNPTVTVRSGQFSVLLGNINAISQDKFSGEERYIGIQVQDYQEMQPRQKFASVPHAMIASKAKYADSATNATNASHSDRASNSDNADSAYRLGSSNIANAAYVDQTGLIHIRTGDNENPAFPQGRLKWDNASGASGMISRWTNRFQISSSNALQLVPGNNENAAITIESNGNTNINGALTVNGDAPIRIGRFENVGNDADFYVSIGGRLNSNTWKCTATAWSAYYDIQENDVHYNGVWTYTDANGWWKAYVQFSSHNDNEDPDVDILCIRNAMLYYEGNTGLLHGD